MLNHLKTKQTIFTAIFCVLVSISFSSCERCECVPPSIEIEGISLNYEAIELIIGEEQTLVLILQPINAANRTVTWTSSNTNVAAVDADGKVTAIASGRAVITAQVKWMTTTSEVVVRYHPLIDAGVEIAGIIWATRNVDAPGTFTRSPESIGMFYQWNRRIGWSATNPLINSNGETSWDSSNPTGTSWERENDPCPEGWRVPTEAELRALNNVVSYSTNLNGVAGRFFGTAPNQVFLPYAGWRSFNNGTLNSTAFNYWSSTQQASTTALALHSVGISINTRATGFNIRCVKE